MHACKHTRMVLFYLSGKIYSTRRRQAFEKGWRHGMPYGSNLRFRVTVIYGVGLVWKTDRYTWMARP